LEKLVDERSVLIFQRVEAAKRRKRAWNQRLLGLLLAASLLLAGMILAASGMQGRVVPAVPGLHLVFGLLAAFAALLLALSITFTLGGLALGAGSSPSLGAMASAYLRSSPRDQLIKAALAELQNLEKAEHLLRRVFRWAAILFMAAIIPYLVMVVLLLF